MSAVDLAGFLLARIAEDEAAARTAGGEDWSAAAVPGPSMRRTPDEPTRWIIDSPATLISYEVVNREKADHIARHDPARVLAECEAKRRIVEAEGERWMPRDDLDVGSPEVTLMDGSVIVDGRQLSAVEYRLLGLQPAPPTRTLCLLALPYADHLDYDEAWRP